jgi:hypothetical protein
VLLARAAAPGGRSVAGTSSACRRPQAVWPGPPPATGPGPTAGLYLMPFRPPPIPPVAASRVAFRRGRTVASQYVGRVFSRSPRALAHEVGAGSRPVIASAAGSGSAIPSSFHPPELVDLRAGEERLLKQAEYVAVGVVEPGPTPGIRRHEHAVLGPDVWKVVVLQRQARVPAVRRSSDRGRRRPRCARHARLAARTARAWCRRRPGTPPGLADPDCLAPARPRPRWADRAWSHRAAGVAGAVASASERQSRRRPLRSVVKV